MKCRPDFPTLPMPELRLYHSRRKCSKFLKRHGIDFDTIENADAQTWTFQDDTGSYAVVLFDRNLDHDYWEDMGMLAHEATHVMLAAFGMIGETEPAEEEMCYVVQAIATVLCKMHFCWKEKHLIQSESQGD